MVRAKKITQVFELWWKQVLSYRSTFIIKLMKQLQYAAVLEFLLYARTWSAAGTLKWAFALSNQIGLNCLKKHKTFVLEKGKIHMINHLDLLDFWQHGLIVAVWQQFIHETSMTLLNIENPKKMWIRKSLQRVLELKKESQVTHYYFP